MQQPKSDVEGLRYDRARDVTPCLIAVEPRLDLLDVPVGQLAPHEAIGGRRGLVQPEPLERLGYFDHGGIAAGQDPAIGQLELVRPNHVGGRSGQRAAGAIEVGEDEASGVPELVGEVATWRERRLDVVGIENDVGPDGAPRHQRVAQSVRAVESDHVQRIDPVAERLRHLAILGVAHRTMQIDRAKRDVAHELAAGHDHPRDPEEKDLRRRHERVAGIEPVQIRCVVRPAQPGEGNQPGREPGVEHVVVLAHRAAAVGAAVDVDPARQHGRAALVVAIPDRDPVPPPELPGDAPVADALHPLGILVAPPFRDESEASLAVRVEGGLGERRHPDEPLVREPRLHHGIAAVAMPHRMAVVFHLLQQPGRLELCDHAPPRLVPVETLKPLRRRKAHPRFRGHDVDAGQAVASADLEVGRIVGRRDLDRSGTERGIDGLVGHDRDQPIHYRQPELPADQRAVPLVRGMHRDGRIAQHGLGPGGRDGDVTRPIVERVPQVPELPIRLFLFRLFVRERGETAWAPVDDVVAPVDQPLLVQPDEHLADGAGEILVQREVSAGPVGRAADGLELLENAGAGFADVSPHPLDEGLAAEVEPGLPLLGEQSLDHVLRGDACVVGAGKPERSLAPHALEPDQDVLDGVVEAVTHVENRGHVGRRHDNDVGSLLPPAPVRRKDPDLLPPPVELGFDRCRIVLGRERVAHAVWLVGRSLGGESWSSSPSTRRRLTTCSMPGTARATRAA